MSQRKNLPIEILHSNLITPVFGVGVNQADSGETEIQALPNVKGD